MYRGFDATGGPPEAHDILRALGYLGHVLRVRAGGRGGQQFVLATLAKHDGKMQQKELFGRCDTSPAALSEVLSKLEGEALIERTTSPRDRRQLDVTLTEAGRVRAEQIARQRAQFEADAVSCLSEEEQADLMRLLDKVARHWNDSIESEVSG